MYFNLQHASIRRPICSIPDVVTQRGKDGHQGCIMPGKESKFGWWCARGWVVGRINDWENIGHDFFPKRAHSQLWIRCVIVFVWKCEVFDSKIGYTFKHISKISTLPFGSTHARTLDGLLPRGRAKGSVIIIQTIRQCSICTNRSHHAIQHTIRHLIHTQLFLRKCFHCLDLHRIVYPFLVFITCVRLVLQIQCPRTSVFIYCKSIKKIIGGMETNDCSLIITGRLQL
mmetsp:Transcript_9827/g.17696  ORF Transcript_9827/g.17696 Transcript_9827/m.17696 type:complete len:228 (+) Transcript_9827:662-1345(+)